MGAQNEQQVINQNELRIVGMSRSGVHAIINWITAQVEGRYCFLNCVELKKNPFLAARPLESGTSCLANYDAFDLEREQQGDLTRKDYLLYNYEDCFLGMVCSDELEAHRDEWVGRSGRRVDVLVLRDPFNLFASRKKAEFVNPDKTDRYVVSWNTARRIWKQYAREFIRGRRYLRGERVLISYNEWVQSRSYRRQVAGELGLDFTDAGFESVAECAGGSSFDGTSYDGQATQMEVLRRWRHYEHDEQYRDLFDEEMLEFSEEIFGPLPGTEELVRVAAAA